MVKSFRIDDLITNGSSAGKVVEVMSGADPRWRTPGIRVANISLEEFGGNKGMSSFVPEYLLGSWRLVSFDWAPVVGGTLEERYVWAPGYRWLQREVRPKQQPVASSACPHCGGAL